MRDDRIYLVEITDADSDEVPSAAVRDCEAELADRLDASVRTTRLDAPGDSAFRLADLVPPSRLLIPLLALPPLLYGLGLWLQPAMWAPVTRQPIGPLRLLAVLLYPLGIGVVMQASRVVLGRSAEVRADE